MDRFTASVFDAEADLSWLFDEPSELRFIIAVGLFRPPGMRAFAPFAPLVTLLANAPASSDGFFSEANGERSTDAGPPASILSAPPEASPLAAIECNLSLAFFAVQNS